MILYHGEPVLYSLKPLIALEEIGVAYERRRIGAVPMEHAVPNWPCSAEERINLEREGAVLVDGDTRIASSFFQLEYIAERCDGGAALLPDDALARYRVQVVGQITAGQVAPVVSLLGLAAYPVPQAVYLAGIAPPERADAWRAAVQGMDRPVDAGDRLRLPLARLEAMLAEGGGRWFDGAYSIADIDVFAMLRPLPELAPEVLDDCPLLAALLDRVEARPATQAALALRWDAAAPPYRPGPEVQRWG